MNASSRPKSQLVSIGIFIAIAVTGSTIFYSMSIADLITQFTAVKLFQAIIALSFPFVFYFEIDMVLNARQTPDHGSLFNVYKNHPLFAVIGGILVIGWFGLVVSTVLAMLHGVTGDQRPTLGLLVGSIPIFLIGAMMAQRGSGSRGD